MSKLGKIFLWIAVAGVIVSAVFGFLVIKSYNDTTTTLTQTKASLVNQTALTKKALDEKDALNQQKLAEDKVLADTKDQVDSLTKQMADAQKKVDDITTAMADTKSQLDKATAALQHVQDVLGMSPEDMKAAKEKAEADLAASISEQKVLETSLTASKQDVARLHEDINRAKTGNMPPGISGRVTFVNRTWNFVVLDVGLSNGVVPNGELIVFRKTSFLGKIKVTTAEENTAVADILPDAKGDIQVGDYVLN